MKFTQSITVKALGIGVLALLMLIPLYQVQWLVSERNEARMGAVASMAKGWGGSQTVGGPVLVIPSRETLEGPNGKPYVVEHVETILPDSLNISGGLEVQMRHYGIYEVPLYVTKLHLTGKFLKADIQKFMQSSSYAWSLPKGQILISIGDLGGLRSIEPVAGGALKGPFVSTDQKIAAGLPAVSLPLDASAAADIPFGIELTLAGSESISFLPLARVSDVSLSAPWGSPSFTGMTLPVSRTLETNSFRASWKLLDLNRGFGQHWSAIGFPTTAENASWPDIYGAGFGVTLYQPASVYQQNDRAGKYGILFIALTFIAFFMFEILDGKRLHAMQYLLVGLGLATFYLVLLALSEQIGFGAAYAAAAAAVVAMVGGYGAAILKARKSGALLGGMLAVVYGFLYALIVAEQYSLLAGSLALLLVIAALMYLTRNVDWFRYNTANNTALKHAQGGGQSTDEEAEPEEGWMA